LYIHLSKPFGKMVSKTSLKGFFILLCGVFPLGYSTAQDLDPRAYIRVPVKTTTAFLGYAGSRGGVVSDPTVIIQNIEATIHTTSVGASHSFDLFGMTSQILVVLPYSWANVSGDVGQQSQSVNRSGMADMRARISVLVFGAPAANLAEVKAAPRSTLVGVSLNLIAPTGQFFSDKLINLGTNRWSFRPEIAISQPISKRWLFDFYSGVWVFTNNISFFPGNLTRTQNPMGAFQAHLSYNIGPIFWIAIDGTYYVGGESSINNQINDDRVENTRLGITAVIPTGKTSSLKVAVSTGVQVRIGKDFNTLSVGWQKTWLYKEK
jgi:hypothetical protein